MKSIYYTSKVLKEYIREWPVYSLLLFFPVLLVVIYSLAFKDTGKGIASFLSIAIVDEDSGSTSSRELIQKIRDLQVEKKPVFDVRLANDLDLVKTSLLESKLSLAMVIPKGFHENILSTTIPVYGNPAFYNYSFAFSFLDEIPRELWLKKTNQEESFKFDLDFLPGTGTLSDFQVGVPGILVFGILILILSTGTVLVRENTYRTLMRLKLSGVRASQLFFGITLAQIVVACIQLPLTFFMAVLLGFKTSGSFLNVFIIGLFFSLVSIGLGLVVACFARTDSDAVNYGTGLMLPLAFLSGGIFPFPQIQLFTVGTHTFMLNHFLPSTHAAEAIKRLLVYGEGIQALGFNLVCLFILTVIIFAFGIFLYQKRVLSRQIS